MVARRAAERVGDDRVEVRRGRLLVGDGADVGLPLEVLRRVDGLGHGSILGGDRHRRSQGRRGRRELGRHDGMDDLAARDGEAGREARVGGQRAVDAVVGEGEDRRERRVHERVGRRDRDGAGMFATQ